MTTLAALKAATAEKEKPPFPVYRGHWELSSKQLARFSARRTSKATEISHDCGMVVATIETGSSLALIAGAIASHVCPDTDTPVTPSQSGPESPKP